MTVAMRFEVVRLQRGQMMFELGGATGEGRGIEACGTDQSELSAEKFFHLHFSLIRMGSRGSFVLCAS